MYMSGFNFKAGCTQRTVNLRKIINIKKIPLI